MWSFIIRAAIVIGIIAIYSVVCWGLAGVAAAIAEMTFDDDLDLVAIVSWFVGLFAFIILSVYTITRLGLWP